MRRVQMVSAWIYGQICAESIALLLFCLFCGSSLAQTTLAVHTNWTQFHFRADGARLNPHEDRLNPHTVRKLKLKWRFTTGSAVGVYSSPAVVYGVVYVGADDNNVYALNAKTGVKLWSYLTGGYVNYSSPAVASGVVYVGSWDGRFVTR